MRISDWSSDVCSSDLRLGVLRAGEDAADQLVRHLQGVVGQSFLEVEQERNQRGALPGGNISLDHIGRRSATFPNILTKSVRLDAASHVRRDAELTHLPQAVGNMATRSEEQTDEIQSTTGRK